MKSQRMFLWKMILAAAALKGRKACAQPADARDAQPGTSAKILAFMVAPQGRPVVAGK